MGRKWFVTVAGASAAVVTVAMALHSAWSGSVATERVSVTSLGVEATGNSTSAAISPDGRYVAFISSAENLVPNDSDHVRDVFVRDRMLGATDLVSVASDGAQGNGNSSGLTAGGPAISPDARFVAFASSADNLVPDDANHADDIFVRDRVLGTTERVSVASDGTEGNDVSSGPSISADGRYVAFSSMSDNLVADDSNHDRDVFLHDRQTGATEPISVATDGTRGNFASGGYQTGSPRITSDGRYVVYGSYASNLVPNDLNTWDDIFVRDRVAGTTERVSTSSTGSEGNGHSLRPSISNDGRFVVFATFADNLGGTDDNPYYDLYLRDRQAGTTTRLTVGMGGALTDGDSLISAISSDGRYVAFESAASNLVPNDVNGASDVFELDRQGGQVDLVSRSFKGVNANGPSGFPAISNLGLNVAFESFALNLVPQNDGNNGSDVFVRGPSIGPTPTPSRTRTATRTPTPPPGTATPAGQRGDTNCNGRLDSVDAALILQYDAGLAHSLPCTSNADANRDGHINAIDSALVLQVVAGLLGSLPA
jgi:Tol biopolymer transport system component